MAVPRALYITFNILYLITLALVLWFLLYYSGVPGWVWIFFAVAILVSIISLIISEVVGKNSSSSKEKGLDAWSILFILLQIASLILVIIGLIFVIRYSSIPWWVWLIFVSAIILVILAAIMSFIPVAGPIISLCFLILALIAYIVGLILIVVYSNAPWWIWILIGIMILFNILSSIFETLSQPKKIVSDCLDTSSCDISIPTRPNPGFDELIALFSEPVAP